MNTQNSQTAATPTAGTWFKNLSLEQLRARRTQHMRLTELENVLVPSFGRFTLTLTFLFSNAETGGY